MFNQSNKSIIPISKEDNKMDKQLDNKQINTLSKQLFDQYLSNLSAESLLLSAIESLHNQRSNILDQILQLEGIGPFKLNGRVFTIIKRYGKCHEREIRERNDIKIVA